MDGITGFCIRKEVFDKIGSLPWLFQDLGIGTAGLKCIKDFLLGLRVIGMLPALRSLIRTEKISDLRS